MSESFAVKLMQRRERHGSPAPGRESCPRGSGKLDRLQSYLIDEVEAQPDTAMPELVGR